jgi:hypothetical protein
VAVQCRQCNKHNGGKKFFFDFEDIGDRLMDNDTLLLCSDGLSGELPDEEIENLISEFPENIASLIQAVKEKGGMTISLLLQYYIKFEILE